LLGNSIFLHPILVSAFGVKVTCLVLVPYAHKPGAFFIYYFSDFLYFFISLAFSAASLLLFHLQNGGDSF